ncbi:hypothetical protein G9A89_011216 [Geosiphon pyriformis]|nr:hypothetical protein G9A89_011216 [Geosiphon pyriformis]
MASIKVIYKSTVRRFTLASPSTTSWAHLEDTLRNLFSIPSTIPIQLSYTDEDGDVITLSTDFELQEILTQQPQGTTFKFNLTTLAADGDEANKDAWVLESRERAPSVNTVRSDETVNIREGVAGLQIQEEPVVVNPENSFLQNSTPQKTQKPIQIDEKIFTTKEPIVEPQSRPPSYYHAALSDEANDPISPQNDSEKGKKKDAPGETSAKAASSSTPKTDESTPIIDLAANFEKLLNQFHDVLISNPQIIETANGVMEQILAAVPVDLQIWKEWLASFRNRSGSPTDYAREDEGDDYNDETNQQQQQHQHQRQQRQQQGGPSFFPNFPPGFPFHNGAPWDAPGFPFGGSAPFAFSQDNFNHATGNRCGRSNYNKCAQRGTGGCRRGPYGTRGRPFGGHQQHWQSHAQPQEEKITQEAIKEKLNILHQMGYWEDDEQNTDLLTRYNGNLERVIEVLIQQHERRDRAAQGQERASSNNAQEGQEEKQPYNL